MVEHGTENAGVDSSTLSLGTSPKAGPSAPSSGSGSVVEHLLAKERVVGSNPIFRSTILFLSYPFRIPYRSVSLTVLLMNFSIGGFLELNMRPDSCGIM